MGPEQLKTAARAASPLIAATTTDQHLQAAIAAERPDLRAALAANPSIYPGLRDWLAEASRRAATEAAQAPEASEAPGAESPAGDPAAAIEAAAAVADVGAVDAVAGGQQAAPTVAMSAPAAAPQAPTAWAQQVPAAAQPVPPTWAQPLPPAQPAAFPSDAQPVRRRRRRVWAVALILLLVLALAGTATAVLLLRRGESPTTTAPNVPARPSATTSAEPAASVGASALPTASASPTEVSRCATDPVYEVRNVRDNGGLEVDVHVSPTCKDGDVLSGASTLVTLSGPLKGASLASSTRVVAAVAVFDLGEKPVAIPASGTDLTLVFSSALSYVNAAQIDVGRAELTVARDSSGQTRATTAPGRARLDTASAPDAATMDAIWLGLLRDQADTDSATVSGPLNGTWVPQLSSKKPGLVLDGVTWDAAAVWAHYLSVKTTYPNAILLYSDDWSVFDAGGHWWVIAAAEPFATAEEANAWCAAQGLSRDDCFAKYVRVGASSEGTTVQR
ncbi:hypothetical protein [Actinomyces respiraculi]|uniref:variant leucine-rich repeat-containing protein n=1 Tax=Actinomyces respiraculi TaxID=2744574 RepID=UPI001423A518|nr:hypothetical protein [Actinomyces respiraculi]